MSRSLLFLCLLVSLPASACRLTWNYPDEYFQPDKFIVFHFQRGQYVAQIDGDHYSIACDEWFRGYLRGRILVAAVYGDSDADYYQYVESEPYDYIIDPTVDGEIIIGGPFDVRLAQPGEPSVIEEAAPE